MKFHVNLKFKDLIFILLIIFLFFIFKNNVFASSPIQDPNYRGFMDFTNLYEDSFFTSSQYENNYNSFLSWFNNQNIYTNYYYFYVPFSNNTRIYLFTSESEASDFFLTLYCPYSNPYYGLQYRVETSSPPTIYSIFEFNSSSNFDSSTLIQNISCPAGNICLSSNYDDILPNTILQFSYKPIILYDSNISLDYYSYNISRTYQPRIGNLYYSIGDDIPSVIDYKKSQVPTITLSNLTPIEDNNGNFYKYNVDISYSIYNILKYSYQWKTPNLDEWVDISSNNLTLDLELNGNYLFRILDKSDNSVVSSSSLTISDISITTPYIINKISTPDSCRILYDNDELVVCNKLYLEPSIYGSNYHYQYSLDNGTTWDYLFSNYSFLVQKNDSVPLRVLDNDNHILWSETLTFTENLDSIPNDYGIKISFDDTFEGTDSNKQFFTKIYFYNLDSNLFHNVYISYDGFNWSLLSLTNYTLYMYAQSNYYTSNNTFYIKILDSNNDIIFTTSHNVKLNKENSDIVGYLENFNRSMQGPISSVINAPLRLVNMLNTGDMCQPINLPFAHIGDIGLPCMRQVMEVNVPQVLNIYQIITTGLIAYFCSISLIKTIKTLVRPDDDRIEVVNL